MYVHCTIKAAVDFNYTHTTFWPNAISILLFLTLNLIIFSDIMETMPSNLYQTSNNFGFDSDMEEESIDMSNSKPGNRSNSDENEKKLNEINIKNGKFETISTLPLPSM